MYKIIINTSQDGTVLIKNCSQYSILESSTIVLHRGENILEDLKYGFYLEYSLFHSNGVISIDLSKYDTSNIIDMNSMFMTCNITELDLSHFDTHNVRDMRNMFYRCQRLKHIKCKRRFKQWCFNNMNFISLPYSMYNGSCGIWEIID